MEVDEGGKANNAVVAINSCPVARALGSKCAFSVGGGMKCVRQGCSSLLFVSYVLVPILNFRCGVGEWGSV